MNPRTSHRFFSLPLATRSPRAWRDAVVVAVISVFSLGVRLSTAAVSDSLAESTNNPNWSGSGIWFTANADGTPSSTPTTTPPAGSTVYAGYQPSSTAFKALNYDVTSANSVLLTAFNLNASSAMQFTLTQNTPGTLLQATTETIGNSGNLADYELLAGTNTVTTLDIGTGTTGQGAYQLGYGSGDTLNAGTVNLGPGSGTAGGTNLITQNGGTADISGNLNINTSGAFNQTGGTLAMFGTETIKSGGLFRQTGGVLLLNGQSTSNSGTFTATGTSVITGNFANSGTAVFGGIQNWSNGVALVNAGGTSTFLTDAGSATSAPLSVLVTAGSVSFQSTQHLASLFLGSGSTAVAPAIDPHTNRTLLVIDSLVLTGDTDNWVSKLDLASNDMDAVDGSLDTITNQVKSGFAGGAWTGEGITSSSAASDTRHLTTLGAILNNDGSGNPIFGSGTAMGLFDGSNPAVNDVLVKFTYYGDANLDGQVDGSDYSKIDNGYNNHLTGWANGDFNYDGVVDGSDYTLIDNAFNNQVGNLTSTAVIAAPTEQTTGGSTVPEPATFAGLGLSAFFILGRRTLSMSRRGSA